jgi:hypothetical protein
MDDKDKLPTEADIMHAVNEYADALVACNTTEKTVAGSLVAKSWKDRIVGMIQKLLYPPKASNDAVLGKLRDRINELVSKSITATGYENDDEAGDHVDMCQDVLDRELRAALMPPFKVTVATLKASNGTTYVVVLKRTDAPEGEKFLDEEFELQPINRNDVNEANEEAAVWARFLRVPFTPLVPEQSASENNTVDEDGASVKRNKE